MTKQICCIIICLVCFATFITYGGFAISRLFKEIPYLRLAIFCPFAWYFNFFLRSIAIYTQKYKKCNIYGKTSNAAHAKYTKKFNLPISLKSSTNLSISSTLPTPISYYLIIQIGNAYKLQFFTYQDNHAFFYK